MFHPLNRLRAFASDRRGTFGIIFALTLFPMVQMAGVAVDYANAMRLNARLKAAADEAALSAVRDFAKSQNDRLATSKGKDVFKSQLKSIGSLQRPEINFRYELKDEVFTATADYSGVVSTYFAKFINVSTINLSGAAQATYKKLAYKDFFFVVDASESMGLAATEKDMDDLRYWTGGCALACHYDDTNRVPSKTNEEIAREHNITLRLDVIKDTIKTLIAWTRDHKDPEYIRFSIYTLRNGLVQVHPLARDYESLIRAVDNIDLATASHDDKTGYTYHRASLEALKADPVFPTLNGDGTTRAKAQAFVFLMTDGVNDTMPPASFPLSRCYYGDHCTGPLDPTFCDGLKLSSTVGVVYTTYLDPISIHYDNLVLPFASTIAPNLKRCASTNFFFEGTYGPDIAAGMTAMFMQAVENVRLSQ